MKTREIVDELRRLGYTGPVSYTKTRLLALLRQTQTDVSDTPDAPTRDTLEPSGSNPVPEDSTGPEEDSRPAKATTDAGGEDAASEVRRPKIGRSLSGWCAPMGGNAHDACPGVFGGNGCQISLCRCTCHADKMLWCLACKTPTPSEELTDKYVCRNATRCHDTILANREANPVYRRIFAIRLETAERRETRRLEAVARRRERMQAGRSWDEDDLTEAEAKA